MKNIKVILFAVATIGVGYAIEIAPRYVALFNEELTFHQTVKPYRTTCELPQIGLMKCTDRFQIPTSLFNLGEKSPAEAVGAGIFISAGEAYCSSAPTRSVKFGEINSPARALDLLKTYQIIDLQSLSCKDTLVIDVWGPTYYKRSGYIGGPLLSGNRDAVLKAQSAIHFFTVEYHYLIAFGLIASLLMVQLLIKPMMPDLQALSPFELFSWAWTAFAIVKSGLPELILPVVSDKLYYVRFSNFVSTLAHVGTSLAAFRQVSRYNSTSSKVSSFLLKSGLKSPLVLLTFALSLSPYFAKSMGPVAFIATLLSFVSAIRSRSPTLGFFGLFALIEGSKLFNLPFTPYGSLTLTFAALILFDQLSAHIRQGSRVANFLIWSRTLQRIAHAAELQNLLSQFGRRYEINRITLIEPRSGGSCQITIYTNTTGPTKTETFYREEIPPVFSHVLTTRDSLIHIHEESEFAHQLRRGNQPRTKSDGKYFSIFPILKDQTPIAAIALTSYPSALYEDIYSKNEFLAAMTSIKLLIAEFLWEKKLALSDDWYKLCLEASQAILGTGTKADGTHGLMESLIEFSEMISKRLSVNAFIARVHPTTRQYDLKVTAGYSDRVANMFQETDFYALAGNTQGPMPLAINRGKAVTVSDLTWLFPVLHPKSRAIFEASKGRSGAAIPIHYTSEDGLDPNMEKKVWGIIWLENEKEGFFTPEHESGLELIASAIASRISKLIFAQKAKEALTGLVRPDIANRLLNGLSVREEESGFLLIADIRGSTKIANRYGADAWNAFMAEIRPQLEQIALKHDFQLQLIIWDAIYFTHAKTHADLAIVRRLPEFATELAQYVKPKMKEHFSEIELEPAYIPARYCLVYGDITRDIQNSTWTITGTAMANASKLESACKNIEGWLFAEETLVGPADGYRILNAINPGTGAKIASFNTRPALVDSVPHKTKEKNAA